ncbi:MAG: Cof-type HAD-IIB family hydrolase [Clostridia bacterium]|nr:Cof-type HAD-IIB family hydrolase [Clostridia bacterium]
MIKILAVDMDGTCLDSNGQMAPETLQALKTAAEKGVLVVPTTGRNVNCLPKALKNQDFYRYIISSNGSLVVDTQENEILFEACFDAETGAEILRKTKGMQIFKAAHIDRDFHTQGRILQLMVKKFFKDNSVNIIYVRNMKKFIRKNNKRIEEIQFFYKEDEGYRSRIKEIIADYPEITVAFSKGYAEIYNKKGSKGTALLALGEALGISADEIACIGDEENDISMFDVAGFPMAMGNGIEAVKERAKVILPTNDEKGVVSAIYDYILK